MKKVKEIKKPVDDELKDKDLAYFIKQYEEMKLEQEGVKNGSDGIKKNEKGEVARSESQSLADLADRQGKLHGRLTELNKDEKLKDYDAVLFIDREILEFMKESQQRLDKARIGKELAWNQAAAIERLDDIIKALQEEKAKKDPFEKPPGGGGGGGGGGGAKPPLIPAAQQLKLLKMLQTGVNRQTVNKNDELAVAKDAAEKNAIGETVQKLGKTQEDIQTVAKKVIDKLKPPAGPSGPGVQ